MQNLIHTQTVLFCSLKRSEYLKCEMEMMTSRFSATVSTDMEHSMMYMNMDSAGGRPLLLQEELSICGKQSSASFAWVCILRGGGRTLQCVTLLCLPPHPSSLPSMEAGSVLHLWDLIQAWCQETDVFQNSQRNVTFYEKFCVSDCQHDTSPT